ncbi:MAG: hypothetical protein CVV51_10090 [Spirochaetae bacterium HGW-Spirochaetae-7]|jgi:hypothetical protein|nr:MAG: hypothetical protein CVV51_10090 [Spirochaetae bacterium HGW-Spirochaetae-7]
MTLLSLLPAIVRRRPGRIELTISPATRLLYVALGFALVLTLVRDPAGSPFAVMFAVVISLAALSEDRWTFDAGAGEMRRRFGVLFLAKSWAVGLDTISSIKVDAEFSGAAPQDPYAKVQPGSARDRCALSLVMGDGRTMVLCSAGTKRLPQLRERAAAIAEATGLPLVEA